MPAGIRNKLYVFAHGVAFHVKGYLIGGVKARMSGAESFGCTPLILGKVRFVPDGRLVIGDRFKAAGHLNPVSVLVATGASLVIGDDFGINHGGEIEAWHDMRIGNNVIFAPNVSIIDDDRHPVEPGAPLYHGPVVIGDNVWLCRNVCIMPGVTIGDGSVIGANSVVTRDIPRNVFAAGAPAKVIKTLDLPDGWVRHGQPRGVRADAQPVASRLTRHSDR